MGTTVMHKIVVTMGDAGGIGPEVAVKALSSDALLGLCNPVIVGRADVIKEALRSCGISREVIAVRCISEVKDEEAGIIVVDTEAHHPFRKGLSTAEAGRAAVRYVKKAVELITAGEAEALVTAPVSKKSLGMAGYSWNGHTELLAQLTGAKEFGMMFVSERLRVMLATIHAPLRTVSTMITEESLLQTFRLAWRGMEMLGMRDGRIAVAGLNPHGGESGLLGDEEEAIIEPAVRKAVESGMNISGPYPPDVVFHKAYHGDFDMVVCMYHDQGLIPFKMIYFDTGVNVTVGLPLFRTSPDHGTAFDIAWQNRANSSSMIEAVRLVAELIKHKKANREKDRRKGGK